MKNSITVEVDRLIGPFVDDALEQSKETPPIDRSRKRTTKKPKNGVKRQKKPGTTPDRAKRRQGKNRR